MPPLPVLKGRPLPETHRPRLCQKTPIGVAVVDGHTSAAWVGDPTERLLSGGSLRSTPATLAFKLFKRLDLWCLSPLPPGIGLYTSHLP